MRYGRTQQRSSRGEAYRGGRNNYSAASGLAWPRSRVNTGPGVLGTSRQFMPMTSCDFKVVLNRASWQFLQHQGSYEMGFLQLQGYSMEHFSWFYGTRNPEKSTSGGLP